MFCFNKKFSPYEININPLRTPNKELESSIIQIVTTKNVPNKISKGIMPDLTN